MSARACIVMLIGYERKRLQNLKLQRMRRSPTTDPYKHVEARYRNKLLKRGLGHYIATTACF